MEKKALGRGLSALIPQKELQPESTSQDTVLQIPVSRIRTNKYQPRVDFNSEKLHELMNSIKEKGVVRPVLVRRAADG